jgi:hypothetical protein
MGEQFAQKEFRAIHHHEMVTALEANKRLVRRRDGFEILLSQFDRSLLIMSTLQEKYWHIESGTQGGQINRIQFIEKLSAGKLNPTQHRGYFVSTEVR